MSGSGPIGPDNRPSAAEERRSENRGPAPGPPNDEGPLSGPRQIVAAAKQTPNPRSQDTSGHLAEMDPRLEAVESGLARIALGQESADTLPSYIKLIQNIRWHLKAA